MFEALGLKEGLAAGGKDRVTCEELMPAISLWRCVGGVGWAHVALQVTYYCSPELACYPLAVFRTAGSGWNALKASPW